MINRVIDAIINDPIALVVTILCVTNIIWMFRKQLALYFPAAISSFFGKKKFFEAVSDKKNSYLGKPVDKRWPGGMDIESEIHSYRLKRCWGQDAEDVFGQVNEWIETARSKKWECAIDFSSIVSMNESSYAGILKAIRSALELNNVGLSIVFPHNIEEKEEGRPDPVLQKLYEKLAEECLGSATIKIIIDTRKTKSMRYHANINVNYITPADMQTVRKEDMQIVRKEDREDGN